MISPYILHEEQKYVANEDLYYFRFYADAQDHYCLSLYLPITSSAPEEINIGFENVYSSKFNLAFSIFDQPNGALQEKGISFKFSKPNVINIITNQGTYSFDFSTNKVWSAIVGFRYINPSTYSSVFNMISDVQSSLPVDFLVEYNILKPSLSNALRYSASTYKDSNSKELMKVYENNFSLWFEGTYKYFSAKNMLQYVYTYPFFEKYVGKEIVNEKGYSIKYVYNGTSSDFVYKLPLKPEQEAVEGKITYSTKRYSSCPDNAFNMCDNGVREGLNWKLIAPHVVQVETEAGKFNFDADQSHIWFTLYNAKNLNASNYSQVFSNISNYSSDFPSGLINETSTLKTPITNLITYDKRSSIDTLLNYYNDYYSLIFEGEYEYYSKDNLKEYFYVYPYFAHYKDVKFIDDNGYTIEYHVNTSKYTSNFTFTLPMEQGGAPITKTLTYQGAKSNSSSYIIQIMLT